ncbi:hypothetical protein [Oceanobacillus sp. 1P07AA]|uniref:hypothetical protein n=1 Tax=Oceanobacillus sp. 1P07AA TaxID=3132293 RepID=UPI0039A54C34
MSEMLLRCPSCQKEVNLSEEVNLDILNTITHKSCEPQSSIKDSGTLEEMIDKYPFFESILHPLADEPLEEEQSK